MRRARSCATDTSEACATRMSATRPTRSCGRLASSRASTLRAIRAAIDATGAPDALEDLHVVGRLDDLALHARRCEEQVQDDVVVATAPCGQAHGGDAPSRLLLDDGDDAVAGRSQGADEALGLDIALHRDADIGVTSEARLGPDGHGQPSHKSEPSLLFRESREERRESRFQAAHLGGSGGRRRPTASPVSSSVMTALPPFACRTGGDDGLTMHDDRPMYGDRLRGAFPDLAPDSCGGAGGGSPDPRQPRFKARLSSR